MMIAKKKHRENMKKSVPINYGLNHTTIETNFVMNSNGENVSTEIFNLLTTSQEDTDGIMEPEFSPRFKSIRSRLSKIDERTARKSSQRTINRSILTDSMTSDV